MRYITDVIHISIHAPRTGSDATDDSRSQIAKSFQSTLPARGATKELDGRVDTLENFNPRSPHGERRNALISLRVTHDISIHAPRTGSDRLTAGGTGLGKYFNPRSPHGERLRCNPYAPLIWQISIHAPRTGSDLHQTVDNIGSR